MGAASATHSRHQAQSRADAQPGAGPGPRIEWAEAAAYTIPTDRPESDGTLAWSSTTIVVVRAGSAGQVGLGYTYADERAAPLIIDRFGPILVGAAVWDVSRTWAAMVAAVRNLGRPGIAATAISAADTALWDLKARLLGLPLADLLGRSRERIGAYGSGGFTSYSDAELETQLGGWAEAGFGAVKMKIGRDPGRDHHRLDVARAAIGDRVELLVDANGAFDRRTAVRWGHELSERGVVWFEEPVSSDDTEGLRFVRDHAAPGLAVAAGEYGWGPDSLRRLVEAGAVDVLQADATRCLGVTGFQLAAALSEASHVPLSTHCAPAIHVHLAAAARSVVNIEWFHDHERVERLLFDGTPVVVDGCTAPDRARPGLGLEMRDGDADRWQVWKSAC